MLIASAVAAFMVVGPTASSMEAGTRRGSGYNFKSAEQCFMKKINQARQRRGLRALQWDKQLGYVARVHANEMARQRAVYHDANVGNEVTRWRSIAQNTGRGRSCKRTFKSFMRSAPHQHNIMGTWRYLGVGIEYSGAYVYVQQIFERNNNPGNVYHWP
ncbi:MAG TPA: CAP domain-containing protein [Actinomycetota bacterium]|nr:CAP domain-containing protein [Actinomycetota bacterium]